MFNFTLGFGLHNNLAVLRYQFLGAKWAERTLVLPRAMPSRWRSAVQRWDQGVLLNPADMDWRAVPLEHFLDVAFLRACTAHLGFRTLTADEAVAQGVPPHAPVQHGYNELAAVDRSRTDERSATSHNFVAMGHEIVSKNPQLHSQIHSFDACIAYSPEMYRAAGQVAASIHRHFGVAVGAVTALHSRMEDDMLAAASDVGDLRFNFLRVIGKIEACMKRVAPASEGRPLFVPTGETFSSAKYDWFRQEYGDRAFSSDFFEPAVVQELHSRQGLDAGTGIIDLLIAQESGLFVGYIGSSLSVRIAQYRLKRGRPSYLYNGARLALGVKRAQDPPARINLTHPPQPTPHPHCTLEKKSKSQAPSAPSCKTTSW